MFLSVFSNENVLVWLMPIDKKWTKSRGLDSEANLEVPETCILSKDKQRATQDFSLDS